MTKVKLNKKEFLDLCKVRPVGASLQPSDKNFSAAGIVALIEIRESIDNYIAAKIQSDKTIEGVLTDIQGGIAGIAENEIAIDRRE